MKTIPLTQGYETIVDDDTYELVRRWSWCYHGCHYACRNEKWSDGRTRNTLLHRIVALARPWEDVHHRDENGLNNLRENLIVKTPSLHRVEHRAQQGPLFGRKYRGAFFKKETGKWIAQIRIHGRSHHLGTFDTAEEAALAWDWAARIHFGPDCFQNMP